MKNEAHWRNVYEQKEADAVSWYRAHLDESLRFIGSAGLARDARIVDVGGGASTLVDDLLDDGFTNIAVLDLAAPALDVARGRLGARAGGVDWIVGDATEPVLAEGSVDFWHDRAVFHFLTDDRVRADYLAEVHRAVRVGGHVLVATFGLDGPTQCSGLPVARYDADSIHATFGDAFEKIGEARELHATPWGSTQSFVYCFCRVQRPRLA